MLKFKRLIEMLEIIFKDRILIESDGFFVKILGIFLMLWDVELVVISLSCLWGMMLFNM